MYNFYYNLMNRKIDTKIMFTDTDSLCYKLHGKNPYRKMYKYKELFDLSNYSKSSKYFCSDNKKVVGKTKDEYGGLLVLKFISLKLKMYSILDENNNEKCTNKGHNAFIEFQEFHDTLFQKKILRHAMKGIKSKDHNSSTYQINKISLSYFDDKRYILKNGIYTLAFGHKEIRKK